MASSQPIALELSLVESSGPWFKPGSPVLYCWFHAVHLPGTPHDEGKISVLSMDRAARTWREFTRPVTIDQSREILAGLEALGLPGRTPDVEGVVDTSDGWDRVVFWVRTEGGVRCMDLDMHSSGFDGKDAEALRELFRRLFALAGFAEFSPVVYGERRARRCS
ncbi:MAG: hypothetical protein L0Z62_46665 [Gemmataceae bacterium]|nr:hypothetical protein [Gemmataceae bacterium]